MSVIINNPQQFSTNPFHLQVLAAVVCRNLMAEKLTSPVKIKWPNDIYINDRKAGGILIENIYRGKEWQWTVIGIGINVNQDVFPEGLEHAISLKQLSGITENPETIAKQIHCALMTEIESFELSSSSKWLHAYQLHLFKKGEWVNLKKDDMVLNVEIQGVSEEGKLLAHSDHALTFNFGEVEWMI